MSKHSKLKKLEYSIPSYSDLHGDESSEAVTDQNEVALEASSDFLGSLSFDFDGFPESEGNDNQTTITDRLSNINLDTPHDTHDTNPTPQAKSKPPRVTTSKKPLVVRYSKFLPKSDDGKYMCPVPECTKTFKHSTDMQKHGLNKSLHNGKSRSFTPVAS